MSSYCLKCKKNTENKWKKKLKKYAICGAKKSTITKKQEAKGILNSLGLKTPLNKVSLLVDILLWVQL